MRSLDRTETNEVYLTVCEKIAELRGLLDRGVSAKGEPVLRERVTTLLRVAAKAKEANR